MRTLLICLFIILLALQYKLWIGDGGVSGWLNTEHKLDLQKQENKKMSERNQALLDDITELKSGDQALEEHARFELGMIKSGEVYYQFAE